MSAAFETTDRSRRALLVTYGASHVAKVAPVMKELQGLSIECILIALTVGFRRAQQLDLKPLGYKDFIHLADDPDLILARGRSLMSGNTHPDVDEVESACYLGINYQEWVDEVGEENAARSYAERGRRNFLPVNFMGRILDALQPGVVVATSTPRSEEACIRAAVQRGIPTLTMVDLFAPPSDPFLTRPVHADAITVVSQEVRAAFIDAGLNGETVHVTGSPDFDALFDPIVEAQGADFLDRMGWQGLHVVMWAGILEPDDGGVDESMAGAGLASQVEDALRALVASDEDIALIVRYHPSEYQHFPPRAAQDRVYVSPSGAEPVSFLLHAADVIINQVSTVGFEAALLGKRVLNLGFSAWVERVDFDLSSLGPSERVPDLASLVPMLQSDPTSSAADTMNVPGDRAAPRVAALVRQLLQEE